MKKPTNQLYKPTFGFYEMTGKNFLWGLIGLVFGITINNIAVLIAIKLNIENEELLRVVNLTLHLFLCSVFLASIHVYQEYFSWSWQNVTPGLFFVSFFFGSQFNAFTEVQNAYVYRVLHKKK